MLFDFDDSDDLLSCSICKESFNSSDKLPKLIPCGHTFCSQCLMSGQTQCATCKEPCHFDKDAVELLPNNLTVISFLRRFDRRKESQSSKSKFMCSEHNNVAQHVCLTCMSVLCSRCLVAMATEAKHTRHNIVEIKNAFTTFKEELDDQSQLIDNEFDSCIYKIKRSTSNFHNKIEKVKKEVEEEGGNGHNKVNSWRNETVKSVGQTSSDFAKVCKGKEETLTQKRTEIQEHIQKAINNINVQNVDALYSKVEIFRLMDAASDDLKKSSLLTVPAVKLGDGVSDISMKQLVIKQVFYLFNNIIVKTCKLF